MADIIIHYKNELMARIQCSVGIGYQISEHFAFLVPGYKFMTAYKAGRWDGKIRLFNLKTRQFYIGLFDKLFQWCKENEYTIQYADKDEFFKNKVDPLTDQDWDWLKSVSKYQPKWYQKLAVDQVFQDGKVLILSPTGSGKSFIAYMIVRYYLQNFQGGILITVPSTLLVQQLYSDFEGYVTDGWSVADNVTKIYSGKEKYTNHPVKISTWQSAVKLPDSWFKGFQGYICDQAHMADGKSISSIVSQMAHARLRVGLTGTLDGTKMHELQMQSRFGRVRRAAKTKQLQDQGDLTPIDIDCLQLRYTDDQIKLVKNLDYQGEISFIVDNPRRNQFLARTAIAQKGNTLMLFNYIEKHGRILKQILEPLCEQHGKQLYWITGEIKPTERDEIRKMLEENTNCILLASYGTVSVGVNIQNLDNLIFCHPIKSPIRVLQSIGRILRALKGKHKVKLIDIADDLSYNTRKGTKIQNTVLKHFLERLKIYVGEKWKYKIIPLKL